jgi:hypothetical protein
MKLAATDITYPLILAALFAFVLTLVFNMFN